MLGDVGNGGGCLLPQWEGPDWLHLLSGPPAYGSFFNARDVPGRENKFWFMLISLFRAVSPLDTLAS